MRDPIALHEAYKRGDLKAVKELLGNPADFPNSRGPQAVGKIVLEYAIYHSPLPFVRALLELGANPNYAGSDGFPSLLAALAADREDRYDVVELLLRFGADLQQRGVNDYTPLHYAAARNDVRMVKLLLAHGADPTAKTGIDDFTTPQEEAESRGFSQAAQILKQANEKSRRSK
jgi:ankyrin repeat protein